MAPPSLSAHTVLGPFRLTEPLSHTQSTFQLPGPSTLAASPPSADATLPALLSALHPDPTLASTFLLPGAAVFLTGPEGLPAPSSSPPGPLTEVVWAGDLASLSQALSSLPSSQVSVVFISSAFPSQNLTEALAVLCPLLLPGVFIMAQDPDLTPSLVSTCPCPSFSCWRQPAAPTSTSSPTILQLQPPNLPSADGPPPPPGLLPRLPAGLLSSIQLHIWVPADGLPVTGGRQALRDLVTTLRRRGFSACEAFGREPPSSAFAPGSLILTTDYRPHDGLVRRAQAAGARVLRWILAWEDEEDGLRRLSRQGAVLIPPNTHTLDALPFSSPSAVLAPPLAAQHYLRHRHGAPHLFKRQLVLWDNDHLPDAASAVEVAALLPASVEVMELRKVRVFPDLMPALLEQARAVVDLHMPVNPMAGVS